MAVVDLSLPEADGLAVVSELRKSESTSAIRVVVITGDPGYYQFQQNFLQAGQRDADQTI